MTGGALPTGCKATGMMVLGIVAVMAIQAVINLFGVLGVARDTAIVQGVMADAKIRAVATPAINAVSQLIGGVIYPQGLRDETSRPSQGKRHAKTRKKEHQG